MNYYIDHNQDKARPYEHALKRAGHHETNIQSADFCLVDHNWSDGLRNETALLDYCWETKKPVFMIPHGFRGYLFWDAVYEISHKLSGVFVPSIGQKEILEKGGFPVPIHITGYPWCKVKPFSSSKLEKVLFAPMHPDWDGTYKYSAYAFAWNVQAFQKLINIEDKIQLTIYHQFEPIQNGLWLHPNVKYVPSDLNISNALKMIEEADLVIANDTFASLAIASGKSTVMFDDSFYDHIEGRPSKFFEHYHIYPYNILWEEDTLRLFNDVIQSHPKVELWKYHYIGNNFNEDAFLYFINQSLRVRTND